jgi:endonuclease YncB( thermonuclease family)|tara:strand:+ start:132 stop:584 length:453 start_codon:yes stop_codon:yes gene_type:complete
MTLKKTFIFTTAILFAIFSAIAVGKEKEMVIYDFPITRVIDGDTVAFEANFLPAPLKQELSIRVFGVDTPEKSWRGSCDLEKKLGEEASQFTKDMLASGKKIQVAIQSWDKYGGRVLGDIIVDGVSLRYALLENGYAREYFGDKKVSWCL